MTLNAPSTNETKSNPKAVITDRTSKVPFVAIDRPIKSIHEMNFETVKDFDYPSKATRYFEERGAICYRDSGKALYMIPRDRKAANVAK